MTQEEKAQAYDEAIKKANELIYVSDKDSLQRKTVEHIFPELKESESEDEKIRKAILNYFTKCWGNCKDDVCGIHVEDAIAWLEKQGKKETLCDKCRKEHPSHSCQDITALGRCALENQDEQKPADVEEPNYFDDFRQTDSEVEPKFKVGDWVVYNRNDHDCSREIIQVYDIRDGRYYFNDNIHFSWSIKECDEKSHLWTIQDAKDGDVLYTSSTASNEVFIFKELTIEGYIECYCSYDSEDKYREGEYHFIGKPTFKTHPATKEQRDLLFAKMKEAGYEWDAEKKEMKKIEQKPTWSEEDDQYKRNIESILNKDKTIPTDMYFRLCDWLKSLKDRVQPKQEWSEKDNQYLCGLIGLIEQSKAELPITLKGKAADNCIDWLKSLKYRVQPKVELTQLDKNILETAIAFVEHNNHFNCWRGVDKHTVLSALHSLRPQNTWKPSEGQLECLGYAIEKAEKDWSPLTNNRIYLTLKALKEQLEKL